MCPSHHEIKPLKNPDGTEVCTICRAKDGDAKHGYGHGHLFLTKAGDGYKPLCEACINRAKYHAGVKMLQNKSPVPYAKIGEELLELLLNLPCILTGLCTYFVISMAGKKILSDYELTVNALTRFLHIAIEGFGVVVGIVLGYLMSENPQIENAKRKLSGRISERHKVHIRTELVKLRQEYHDREKRYSQHLTKCWDDEP